MKLYKRITSLLLCLVSILTLTACYNSDKAYIYFTLTEVPQTLDPQTAQTDTELMIVRNIFEGLLRKDENGKIACGVAKSYKKDGLTYTFNLRKDAVWSNEESVTAHDFVFAFRRAVDPKTEAPHSKMLENIENAKQILKGKKSADTLGVKAIDKHTLQIKLSAEDKNFEETLTTSVAMPCNEKFFNASAGKYGLDRDYTLSNGSYRLAKWSKEIFGIRLYRNDFYKGDFRARNAAVFLTLADEMTPLEILKEEDADIAFINPQETKNATAADLKTASFNKTCWFLTLSDGFSKEMRSSLISLATPQVFAKNLPEGYLTAQSIFPPSLSSDAIASGMPVYDLENAKKLFAQEVEKLSDKKFPADVVLYYYDDGISKSVVTDIVGHWQNQLGAFVNIESVSSPSVLSSQLKEQTYAICIFPISADSKNMAEYLKKFGVSYKGKDLSSTQSAILKSKNISPIMTQKTTIAYRKNLQNVKFTHGNGCIDFAYIVKGK